MKAIKDLRVGDVVRSPLLDEKKGISRVVCRIRPRTGPQGGGLTYVETVHKHERNAREVWELRSHLGVIA